MNCVIIGFFAVLISLCSCQKYEEIIRNDFEVPDPEGNYKWAIQTEGGTYHEQRGSLKEVEGAPSLVVEGQYQYTAPDGQIINVIYRADESGFHAEGAHLPTPPPIPREIQESLDYIARVQNLGTLSQ